MKYRPCNGRCTQGGDFCDGCGRSREEVDSLNVIVKQLAQYAKDHEYENIEDFANSVANGIYYKYQALDKN
jgi:hypothetical protein